MQVESFKGFIEALAEDRVSKKVFLKSNTSEYTYGNLLTRIRRVSGAVKNCGISPGDNVVISVSDDFEMISCFLALLANGITVVLIDPDAKKERVKKILSTVSIHGWICSKENADAWELPETSLAFSVEAQTGSSSKLLNKLLKKETSLQKNTFEFYLKDIEESDDFRAVSNNEIAYIIFTSGSTGNPKGVPISHGNILAHLKTLSNQYELSQSSVIMNFLSLYHADGLVQGALLATYNHVSLIRPFKFEIAKIPHLLDAVYKFKVSHFVTVPTMLVLINKYSEGYEKCFETNDFKYLISSASFLESGLWNETVQRFQVKLVNVYGLTETVAGGLFAGPSPDSVIIGSVGKPVDCEAAIFDRDGRELGENVTGELGLKGDNVFKSYLNSDDNNFHQRFFMTGDLAFRDPSGIYYIKGRLKNVIIKGGINVYPEEIIEILNQHPDILEAHVFGQNDPIWGEKIYAAVVLEANRKLSPIDIIGYCQMHIESEKLPSAIYFVNSLPKGLSGKVQIDELRKTIAMSSVDDNGKSESIRTDIKKLAVKAFNTQIEDSDFSKHSSNIVGWDSLAHLSLATNVEDYFKIQLTTKDILGISTLEALESIVQKKVAGQ
ncbi:MULTISPECIES: AMP-binding protein [unclassified Imperialibacter]|uniref:AMP-binding protein n=1 Tax=unclassified Imperialibacter TaxID=2629706 RepID=UPI0012562FC6|nr:MULTISPECIES: AMP-binding protein [unclassified Imperialibacter]CAD5276494.1 Long-chain acyl-CoA synthetase [Imperialibacter sp. 75]CAD5294548.1 Long-chain acyl-CoA synthetase [Imperialibacter sp. 89]VVT12469.1 Long-chain acyl-CoA synthetase [Imperialibacter sp. EC-SDR9]